eukprot:1592408-Rhodomonas_salina.1
MRLRGVRGPYGALRRCPTSASRAAHGVRSADGACAATRQVRLLKEACSVKSVLQYKGPEVLLPHGKNCRQSDIWVGALSAYARATRCPVLTWPVVLPGARVLYSRDAIGYSRLQWCATRSLVLTCCMLLPGEFIEGYDPESSFRTTLVAGTANAAANVVTAAAAAEGEGGAAEGGGERKGEGKGGERETEGAQAQAHAGSEEGAGAGAAGQEGGATEEAARGAGGAGAEAGSAATGEHEEDGRMPAVT